MEPVRTPAASYAMVSVPEAVRTVLGLVKPLEAEEVDFEAALGRVLAADVQADEPIPAYRASIKVGGGGVREVLRRRRACLF